MKKNKTLFWLITLVFISTANLSFGATAIVIENFEAGPAWNYSEEWNIYSEYLANEWTIVSTSPRSGSYCAESNAPGNLWIEDSVFAYSLPLDKNEIFIRFWYKASGDQSAWWAQFMRFFGEAGYGNDLEIGMGVDGGTGDIGINTGDSNVFGTLSPISTGWGNFLQATEWTEYAVYINYSQNELFFWKNASSYKVTDPSFRSINVNWQAKYGRIIFPIYYKRTIEDGGSWRFWVDDMEIWDGIPSLDYNPSPGDVTNFSAQPEDSQIILSWTNPTDNDFSGTMIRYTTGSSPYPPTHNDGILVCDRAGAPGSNDSFTATALDNGVQYNFSAFTYDDAGNYSHTAHVSATPQILDTGGETLVWSAMEQSGDSTWSDSGALWTPRVLIDGSSISAGFGSSIKLGFQGRASGDFVVKGISIAERDIDGAEGDVIDSTWTKIVFDGNSLTNWAADEMIVPAGTEKFTDPMPFDLVSGKDYYITFHLVNPSAYLMTQTGYREMYFDDAEREIHTEDVDWLENGYSTYDQRIHGISSIYIINSDIEFLTVPKNFQQLPSQ